MSFHRSLAKYSSWLIRVFEKSKIKRFGSEDLIWQPVFIIGAPRTGSTILYEILTNSLDVIYPDNLAEKFYRNMYFGFWLSNRIYGNRAHNSFLSHFGNTEKFGQHAPNEYAGFWYRWIPRGTHYTPADYLSTNAKVEIRSTISAVTNKYKKPLLYKNLNLGQRMGMLSEVFPQCKFIFIKRNPVFTVQSLFLAKRKLGFEENDWWSVMPKNVQELKQLPEIERLTKQVFYTERQITQDSNLFPKGNIKTIRYQELYDNLDSILGQIHKFIGEKVNWRSENSKPELRQSDRQKVELQTFQEIERQVSLLDWQSYGVN